MTDWKALRDTVRAHHEKTKPRRPKERDREVAAAPVFGAQPYGARQCAACHRWFPREHFWRRSGRSNTSDPGERGRYVKRCKECIRSSRRQSTTHKVTPR
jgi:hypothetical protein